MPEYWDLLDEQGNDTGVRMLRGEKQPHNSWHGVVGIVIQNNIGELLFIKRAATKEQYPSMWEHIGGCIVSGETPKEAAYREVYEEIGISISEENLVLVDTFFEKTAYVYTFYIQKDINIEKCLLQKNEVDNIKWVDLKDVSVYLESEEISPAAYRRLNRIMAKELMDSVNLRVESL